MANSILHKSNATTGVVPAAASLTPRELSINTADGRLFTKTDGATVQEFARVGKGMSFGNAADANTTVLDWYEEGTSTIILGNYITGTYSDFSVAPTYTANTLYWTRMGNRVFWDLYLSCSGGTASASGSGFLVVSGLPFAAASTTVGAYGQEVNCELGSVLVSRQAYPYYFSSKSFFALMGVVAGAVPSSITPPNYNTAAVLSLRAHGVYRCA
jgi:hypothetical protein